MSGSRWVIDTNIILYLLRGDATLAEFLHGKKPYISFITELELIGYPKLSEVEHNRIVEFLLDCTIVPLSEAIKSNYIEIRRKYGLRLGDALVAATAIHLNQPMITADKGFSKVIELQLTLYAA